MCDHKNRQPAMMRLPNDGLVITLGNQFDHVLDAMDETDGMRFLSVTYEKGGHAISTTFAELPSGVWVNIRSNTRTQPTLPQRLRRKLGGLY